VHLVTALHRIAKAENGTEVIGSEGAGKLLAGVSDLFQPEHEASPLHLANTAWALAALPFRDLPLLQAISRTALSKISQLDSQNLSNIAWAFATLEMLDLPLLAAIADQA